TQAAEFNVYADPHAAAAVFRSGIPVDVYGLDVTNRATLKPAGLESLRKESGRVLTPVCAMLDHYMTAYKSFGRDALALHDPLVVANIIDPAIVTMKPYYADVETSGEYTLGKTVVDTLNVLKKKPNARFGVELDNERFLGLLTRLLRSYDRKATTHEH
ncbi:MAG: nucleoside hydrolase, partial [Spirochaetales bacterium]|nr:nucleoside hydrolase [Spirochaetales bacterium]